MGTFLFFVKGLHTISQVSSNTFLRLLPVLERTNLSGARGHLLQRSRTAESSTDMAPAVNAVPPSLWLAPMVLTDYYLGGNAFFGFGNLLVF